MHYRTGVRLVTLGERLKKLRNKRGWSQVFVANKLGLKRSSTYANYEYGIRDPDTDTLVRLAEIFETTTDYLLNGEYTYKDLTPNETDFIIREIVKEYDLDLTIPGQREKLEDLIKIVLTDYTKK